jgi:hypothetical protein
MTPAMESVLRALCRIEANEAKLDTIRVAAAMGSNHEVAVALHHLERRHQMVSCRETVENGKKCAMWSLTGIGMKWLLGPTAANTGTVADLVQEIKAEQDAAAGARPEPPFNFRLEKNAAAEGDPPDPRLILTLRDDGTLLMVADGGKLHVALTPAQTRQLGRFLSGSVGVWNHAPERGLAA